MATIPARRPFYITQNVTTLAVDLYIHSFDGIEPSYPQYKPVKVSFDPNIAEPLSIDISEYIRNEFNNKPNHLFLEPFDKLKIRATVNGVDEYHTAFNGYEVPQNENYYNVFPAWKNVVAGSKFYLYYKDDGAPQIELMYNDGTIEFIDPSPSTPGINVFSFTPKYRKHSVKLTIKYPTPVVYYFKITQKPYECEVYNVTFMNNTGLWEWMQMTGAKEEVLSVHSKSYTSYATMSKKVYNKNGRYVLKLNTGWLPKEAEQSIESLMMSENIILDANPQVELVLKDTSKKIQNGRKDKMINYDFTFELGKEIITDDVTRVPEFDVPNIPPIANQPPPQLVIDSATIVNQPPPQLTIDEAVTV